MKVSSFMVEWDFMAHRIHWILLIYFFFLRSSDFEDFEEEDEEELLLPRDSVDLLVE